MSKENKFFKIMRGLARGVFTIGSINFILLILTLIIYIYLNDRGNTPQWLEYWFCTSIITLITSGVFAVIGYIKEIATFISNQFKCE